MNKSVMAAVFAVGLAVVGWVAWGFVGASPLALVMTGLTGGVYLLGAWELWQFRAATASLATALRDTAQPPSDLAGWLERLAPALRGLLLCAPPAPRRPCQSAHGYWTL